MARYENTNSKRNKKNDGFHMRTTIYSSIPERDSDIYVITQMGDRLDTLAHQFYGDVNLWWYIAKANNLTVMTLPTGISLRIPGTTQYAIGT